MIGKTQQIWLRQADFDLQAAGLSLAHGYYEWCCYQSQQAAEKALKAFLVNCGWRVPHVHRVSLLYNMCQQAHPDFRKSYIEHDNIEAITFIARYPFAIPEETTTPHEYIDKQEAQECLQEAVLIIKRVREFIVH